MGDDIIRVSVKGRVNRGLVSPRPQIILGDPVSVPFYGHLQRAFVSDGSPVSLSKHRSHVLALAKQSGHQQ